MSSSLVIQTSSDKLGPASRPGVAEVRGPTWSLRIEGRRLAIVLHHAPLPGGAEVFELVVHLPHVSFPFDFREGIERFRHHRGDAEAIEVAIDARVVLDWLFAVSRGRVGGSAQDDGLVLAGRTPEGARFTVRARVLPDRDKARGDGGEPLLVLSLFQVKVYGATAEPWPLLAGRILDLIPPELVAERTLTTAKLRFVRRALSWALVGLGWKLPDVRRLGARGVELREGRFLARFDAASDGDEHDVTLALGDDDVFEATKLRGAFERFVEDLELKRHHGQIDRLLQEGRTREALAEVYRALDGPPRPGFLAERLIGITTTQPVLFDEGERVCRELLLVAPSYEPASCGLVAIHLGRNRPEEAAVELERLGEVLRGHGGEAQREDANAADLTRATLLAGLDPEASREALEHVLERSPDHEEALSGLIALAEQEGDIRRALPLYKRLLFAARSKERTRDAGLRLARHALERHEPEDARVLLKVVLEAAPDDLEAQLALADVEAEEGHGQEAQRILEAALRAVPPSAPELAVRVVTRLARLLLDALADPARARRVLWRAGDLHAVADEHLIALAELANRAREPVLALRFAGQVTSASAVWAPAQSVRAQALAARGDTRAALSAITEVLKREPDSAEALELLERCAPDPARRELLVHELHESAKKVPAGAPRSRILHRVALLYESLGLRWDAVEPLAEAVFGWAPDPAGSNGTTEEVRLAEARAARLMALQAEFGLWPDHQRTGAVRLQWLPARALGDGPGVPDVQTRIEVLVALGRAALVELGDAAGARPYLEEATRLSPRHEAAHELLTDALERIGPLLSAAALVQTLSRLETIRSDTAGKDRARARLAEVQLEALNAPGQARATLGRMSSAAASDPRVLALRRRAGLDADKTPARVTDASAEAAVAPAVPKAASREAEFLAAVAVADGGNGAEARRMLRQILTADPSFAPARELLSILPDDDSVGSVVGAIQAKVDETDRIEAGIARATEHFFDNDLGGARAELDAVLRIDPDVVPALELLVEVLDGLGDGPARARALERLIELVFDRAASARYLRALADAHAAMGDAPEAHAARLRYLRLAPLDLAAWDAWRAELGPGERAEVLEARAEALEETDGRGPRASAAWLEAAEAHLEAGQPDLALVVAGRVEDPEDPSALELVVRAERAAGHTERAREAARKLLPLLLDGPDKAALVAFLA